MPKLSTTDAAERLAALVQSSSAAMLAEIQAELFPEEPTSESPSATKLAEHVRAHLEAEEIVDLWNVLFPADRNVWYDEEDNKIHYNEEAVDCAEVD